MIQERIFSLQEAELLMKLNKSSTNVMQEIRDIASGKSGSIVMLSDEGHTVDDLTLVTSEMLLKITNYTRS